MRAKFTIVDGWTISAIAVTSSLERPRRDMVMDSASGKRGYSSSRIAGRDNLYESDGDTSKAKGEGDVLRPTKGTF